MSEFVVIDLWSQWPAIENHINGWPKERVLQWLARYGEVRYFDNIGGIPEDAYRFWGRVYDRVVVFRFEGSGRIELIFPQLRPKPWE